MSNQHYFDVPFAFSGDVTAIPDPLQTGGTVSFTEGWNYNYQRNLTTDPAALPIDRSTMNWLLLQITTALQALQKETVPEFILASQNGGAAISYGLGSQVLWSASGSAPFTKFVSIIAANINTPSASDVLGTTTGWQVVCDPIATSAQATAGTNNASIMTPLLVAQQTALRALLAGNSSQVFNVGPAVSATQAVQLQQAQAFRGSMQGLTALTATTTLTAAQMAGGEIDFSGTTASQVITLAARASVVALTANSITEISNRSSQTVTINTASGDFINVAPNTLVTSIVMQPGDNLRLITSNTTTQFNAIGGSTLLQYAPIKIAAATASTHAMQLGQAVGRLLNVQTITATGTYTPTAGTTHVIVEVQGAGGGGGGCPASSASQSTSAGSAGAGTYCRALVTSAFSGVTVTIGAAGTAGAAGANAGGVGGATSFGSLVSCPGGTAGSAGAASSATAGFTGGSANAAVPTISGATLLVAVQGIGAQWGVAGLNGGGGSGAANGGSSVLGSGGHGPTTTSTAGGAIGVGYGAGGSGGCSANGGAAAAGGAGSPGIVLIWEYA